LEDVLMSKQKSKAYITTLKKKAANSKYSYSTLLKVYKRGLAAYLSGGSKRGMSQHQWAMARVNSFLQGDPKHDTDLRA
tara:strand:+ start:1035 stop:1271 length:237 start_codon:yes stop_codon:yes gene_type:complete